MSDIVVNKIIKFSADDQLTPIASRISQTVDKITKPKVTKFDINADNSKIQQYQQTLDGLSKTKQTKLEAIADKFGFDNFDNYLKSLPKDVQTELKTKFDKQVVQSAKRDYNSLPDEKKTKLESIAEKQGFTSFKTMFDAVPKEARTHLDFETNKGEFNDIKKAMSDIAEPINKKINVDSTSVDTASKRFGHLKEIIAGTFAGQMIANGFNALTSGFRSATQAGMAYNKEQDTMKTVWTALTTEAPRDGKELVNYINSLSQHSIYAADTINAMSQSFYHVHSNVKETKDWTNAFIALGSTLHMSNGALAESGEQFAKIVAGGKASSEDMAVMINRFPMFGEALQKATGKSMKQLYEMSAKGKLSATQFTETLDYLGKKYSGGTQEAMTSYMGMGMYIHSRFSKLMGDIMSQTFDTTKSASGAIRDLLSDDAMQKYSKAIGSATGKVLNGIGDIIKYIDSHKDTIMKIGKDVGEIASIFGKAVWNDMKSIMTTIANMFGLTDKNAKSSADPLKTFEKILSAIAKHKTAIQVIATTLLGLKAFKLAKNAFSPLTDMLGMFSKGDKKRFNLSTLLNFDDIKGAKGIGGKFSALGKSSGMKFAGGLTAVVGAIDLYKGIKSKNQDQRFTGIGSGIGTAIGGGIGAYFGQPALGAMIGQALGKLGGLGASNFLTGYNDYSSKHKPKNIVQKVGYSFAQAKKQWSKNMTSLKKYHPVLHFLIEVPISMFKSRLGIIASVGRAVMNGLSDLWDIGKDSFMGRFDRIIPDVKKNFSNMVKGIQTDWNNIWNPKNIKKSQPTYKSSNSKTHKTSITTTEIKKVASQKSISKKDIENVKAMAGAVKKYQTALNSLKSSIKGSGITKDLDKLETSFSGTYKSLNKMTKPFGKVTKNFNSLSKFKIGKNDPFKTIKNDLNNFEKYLKKSKLSKYMNDLDKSIKKSKLSKDFSKLTQSLSKDTKKWEQFSKPIQKVSKSFSSLNSFGKMMKKDPFKDFSKDLKNLNTVLKNSKIDKYLENLKKELSKGNLADLFSKLDKSIQANVKSWTKFTSPIKQVTKAFSELNKFIKSYGKSDPFERLGKSFDSLSKTLLKNNLGSLLQSQIKQANKATNLITFDKSFKNAVNNIMSVLSTFDTSFKEGWKNAWKDAKSDQSDALKGIQKNFQSKTSSIIKDENTFSSEFLKGWKSWLSSVKSEFKTSFNSLPGLANTALGKVISNVNKGIGGINSVITEFGGKSLSLAKYATGTSGTPKGNLAVVGEQGYELAYDKANGIYPVGLKGEEIRYLDSDTAVLPHNLSKQFMGMVASLPHHATGKGDTNKASEDMTDYLFEHLDELKKDPVPFLKKPYFEKANFNGNEFISRFGSAISNGFLKAIAEPFKKILDEMDFSGGGGTRPAKAYGSMIRAAAAYMHQKITDFNVDMIERIIANESGGNPHAINLTDSNARAGTPSKGILQYIDPTFNNYAMPGHTNIYNPLDQLIALFNDATWRTDMGMGYNGKYGEWRGSASGPSGPRLMANGGWLNSPTYLGNGNVAGEVAGEPEVVINPARPSAIPLMNDLMYKMADFHPEFKSSNLMGNISSDIGQKLDAVINLLSNINGKNFAPEINVARTSNNLNQQNQRDTAVYGYMQGNRQ